MASLSCLTCLSYAPSNIASKFQTFSKMSSSKRYRSDVFRRWRTSLPCRRNAILASPSLVHEVELWTCIQPRLESFWFLLCPLIWGPLFEFNSESRQLLVKISGSTGSVVSALRRFPLLLSCHWQGVQRGAVQIPLVLILANAFYSNIAAPDPYDTFENVPQDISGGEVRKRIQRPKSKKAEGCTQKCVGTCIRGGAGSPGEGPLNIRKPLVVFKEGFRTRQYCLIECSDICNLIGDGDDGP